MVAASVPYPSRSSSRWALRAKTKTGPSTQLRSWMRQHLAIVAPSAPAPYNTKRRKSQWWILWSCLEKEGWAVESSSWSEQLARIEFPARSWSSKRVSSRREAVTNTLVEWQLTTVITSRKTCIKQRRTGFCQWRKAECTLKVSQKKWRSLRIANILRPTSTVDRMRAKWRCRPPKQRGPNHQTRRSESVVAQPREAIANQIEGKEARQILRHWYRP